MPDRFEELERIARNAHRFAQVDRAPSATTQHPFVARDIHEALPRKVGELFDDGHYAEATYEACKYLDAEVRRLSGDGPKLRLNALGTMSENDEQAGFRFLFAGSVLAIRNPRGHEHAISDDLETCLSHLSLVTMLLRRLERAGYKLAA